MSNIIGIDTASVAENKKIVWVKAKAGGITYAIIRAAWGMTVDTDFAKNWPLLAKAGIVRGAYLFLRFPKDGHPAPSPAVQAERCCQIVGKLQLNDLPISLDVEFPGAGRASTGMTAAQLLAGVRDAWNVLKKNYGVAPIIYTSGRVWLDDLNNLSAPWANESLLWLAKYSYKAGPAVMSPGNIKDPPVPPPWAGTDPTTTTWRGTPYSTDNWFLHQYQGDAVRAPGMPSGNEDMNRFRPMQKCASGERVKWVQRRLGFKGANVDGKFGPMTDKAVRALQASKIDLVVDGIITPRVVAYLCWMNP